MIRKILIDLLDDCEITVNERICFVNKYNINSYMTYFII